MGHIRCVSYAALMPTKLRGDNMGTMCKEVRLQNAHCEWLDLFITMEQVDNDFNGNPMVVFQIWTKPQGEFMGNVWYPKMKGFRTRKDYKYKSYMHGGLYNTFEVFVKTLQNQLMGLN
jgi:hypothetical protein